MCSSGITLGDTSENTGKLIGMISYLWKNSATYIGNQVVLVYVIPRATTCADKAMTMMHTEAASHYVNEIWTT